MFLAKPKRRASPVCLANISELLSCTGSEQNCQGFSFEDGRLDCKHLRVYRCTPANGTQVALSDGQEKRNSGSSSYFCPLLSVDAKDERRNPQIRRRKRVACIPGQTRRPGERQQWRASPDCAQGCTDSPPATGA